MTKCLACKKESEYLIKRIYYHNNKVFKIKWVCPFCDQVSSMLDFLKLKNKNPEIAKQLINFIKALKNEQT
jgi:hypothetical protein